MKISNVADMKLKYGMNLYRDRLNVILDSDIVRDIRIDLPRTFPDNIYFASSDGCQDQLYRVLFALAADNREIGYCQVSIASKYSGVILDSRVICTSSMALFQLYFSLISGFELYCRSLTARD